MARNPSSSLNLSFRENSIATYCNQSCIYESACEQQRRSQTTKSQRQGLAQEEALLNHPDTAGGNTIDNHIKTSHDSPSLASPPLPPTLFLHGLDSSSHTWRNVLNALESKAVALDLRGCGHSPLGDPDSFSPQGLVDDVYDFLCHHSSFQNNTIIQDDKHANHTKDDDDDDDDKDNDDCIHVESNITPFILVGHSMGGRIAMSFAARYPQLIKALVIEDMDTKCRPIEMNIFPSPKRDTTLSFQNDTGITDKDALIALFEREGYPAKSVEKWLEEGRIFLKEDGTYYTEVNPAFRLLCFEQFFLTNHGENVWNELASDSKHRFPIHVMVADRYKTICDGHCIWWMTQVMKENGKFMVLHRYENGTHSIHNSASQAFLDDLRSIIRAASLG